MTLSCRLIPLPGVLALALAGCGSSSPSHSSTSHAQSTGSASAAAASSAPPARATRVTISGYAFHPGTVTVAPGAKITFVNDDQTSHTATAQGGAFDTGTLGPKASRTVVVRKPGTYTYFCQFHAFMKATVIVR